MATVYLGSDHGGYDLKTGVEKYLKTKGYHTVDLGVFQAAPADYPDIAREVAEKVLENHGARGILFCGTGIGMCMTANKVKGIRAANCESAYSAEMSRRHNDANILCLGGRVLKEADAQKLIDIFLETPFEETEERHVRRVKKIEPPTSTSNPPRS